MKEKKKIIPATPGFWALQVELRENGGGAVNIEKYPIIAWRLDCLENPWPLAIFDGMMGEFQYQGVQYPNNSVRSTVDDLLYDNMDDFRCHMQNVFKEERQREYESPI